MKEEEPSQRRRDRIALILAILTLAVSLAAVWAQLGTTNEQLAQSERVSSAQYVLDMRDQLDSNKYDAITNAVQDNGHTYSPLQAGFTVTQLEDYMGQFETIGDLVRDGVITPAMAYDEVSYDTEKLYCNDDVQNDIAADRQEAGVSTGTDAFWSGFQYMATLFLQQDGYACTSTVLDNQ
jgi:hypothetical protein